jgi:hypothetical protein
VDYSGSLGELGVTVDGKTIIHAGQVIFIFMTTVSFVGIFLLEIVIIEPLLTFCTPFVRLGISRV